jgi:integrase
LLITGQRRSEVSKMTWGELNLPERSWTLPKERTKAARRHEIPLSDIALSILAESPRLGNYVFSATGARPVCDWPKAKASLDQLAIPDWHVHDLRRTCATGLARCGADRITIGKILNHAENEVTAIYDRHSYGDEKREALDKWGEHLAGIVAVG